MPHDEADFSGEVWDEYQWERFLQEQDRNTEKYFGLLETFADHPDRDELIAREMGWDSCADDSEIEEIADLLCGQEFEDCCEDPVDEGEFDKFTQSPIYEDTLRLHRWSILWRFASRPAPQSAGPNSQPRSAGTISPSWG
jgi:hypothetical protein